MIDASAREYLGENPNITQAHLVEVELAGSEGVFAYLTDFRSNVTWDGKVYEAGKVTKVGNVILTQGLTNYKVSVTIPAEYDTELQKATSDASYEGRIIKVYRAILNDKNEVIIMQEGGPLVLFQGEITDIKARDPVTRGEAEVIWECAGELQDFEKVSGRRTDDAQHRGLVSQVIDGVPTLVPSNAAYREEYKTDTGFIHSGHTVAAAIPYLTTEKEYYYKKKWHRLGGSLRTRDVEVERQIDLSISLEAQYLPVVYGVQIVQGVPVFADVLKDQPTRAFVVYAVCEGEIESFLNVYINDASALCGPGANREESALCVGNMEVGDTLSTYVRTQRSAYMINFWNRFPYNRGGESGVVVPPYVETPPWRDLEPGEIDIPSATVVDPDRENTEGTRHGERFTIGAEGGPITLTFYHGKADQTPDPRLVELASQNAFLLQNTRKKPDGSAWGSDYWKGASEGISGAALLDTAYVVAEFNISEDRTEIPTLDFIVQGRAVKVFNNGVAELKQSLNPVWHTYDYLTNDRFGPGIREDKIDLPSWEDTAAKLNEIDTSYEQSYVINWRYVGWKSLSDENRARMQCNMSIDTSNAITKEVETILGQFNGTIIPWRGKYSMSVENDDDPIADLTMDDVLGDISIESKNNRDKWNSISTSIRNPAENWGTTQISFFNSEFLEEDKGIRKQGRSVFSHITNYYTARSWVEYLLRSSRFGKVIRFKTYFKYFYLKPNDNITFTHERYGFTAPNNKFRVVSVEDAPDGSLILTLNRYDSSVFTRTEQGEVSSPPDNEVETLHPPKNLMFLELPQSGINLNTPPGVNCGVLLWERADNPANILRYEVDLGSNSRVQIPLTQTIEIAGETKYYYIVEHLVPNSTYRFRVATVYNDGRRSPYAGVKPTISDLISPDRMDPVTGLRVLNRVEGTSEFVGPNLEIAWDTYPVSYDQFTIQIRDSENNVILSTNSSANEYTFTFAQNSSAYAAATGKVGAYRALRPRVRVVKGSTISEWTEL